MRVLLSAGAIAVASIALACAASAGLISIAGSRGIAPPEPAALTGIDWNDAQTARRMLLWSSPPAAVPLTVMAKIFQRNQVTNPHYTTTFFWGNNGNFDWGAGYAKSYFGSHPYPGLGSGAPNGTLAWEISFGALDDIVKDDDVSPPPQVVFNQWYSQATRVRNVSGSNYELKFYMNLPSTATQWTNTLPFTNGITTPPHPAIVMGQAPASESNPSVSWGGYVGWEEQNAIFRGLQFYSAALSDQEMQDRQACDTDACVLSVCAGDPPCPWYLNMNPTPTDVTDKSGNGHNPTWEGAGRPDLWTGRNWAANDEGYDEIRLAA